MKTYRNLYSELCSYENLELAFKRARKGKTSKPYVIEFEADLENNLKRIEHELMNFAYSPSPLTTFTVRDPKTRKISASHFRDRVVHHALCNIIAPIFEKDFIFDSFANRKGKGTHPAIKRFEIFMRKASQYPKPKTRNYVAAATSSPIPSGIEDRRLKTKLPKVPCPPQEINADVIVGYVLKADIRHYFDTVDHEILLDMIRRKVKDHHVIWLIKKILENHKTEVSGIGMLLGNLTSQFFANVYLHELDLFVKHKLKAKYYIRYVDDFVILHRDKRILEKWKHEIDFFLKENLRVELHPEKTRIVPLRLGITFLGFRIFAKYRLLKKSNARRIWKRLERFGQKYDKGEMNREEVVRSLEGWLAYAKFANTYKFRKRIVAKFNEIFSTT